MMNPLSTGLGPDVFRAPGVSAPTASPAPIVAPPVESSTGFGSMMSSMIQDAVNSVKLGESTAIAGMHGKVPLQQVVEAVMQAEQSLHTAVVVRDKVVNAYLEISRMQM